MSPRPQRFEGVVDVVEFDGDDVMLYQALAGKGEDSLRSL